MIETATVEAPRKRGRPRKQPLDPILEPESPESQPSEPLENDAESTMGDDSREDIPPYPQMPRFSSIERILAVWNSLTERQQEFGNVYLYREWPKMLLVLQKGRLVNENCDKFTVLDGPLSLDLIKQRRRMGKYYVRIVQRVEKPYGQISQSEPFSIAGNLENIEDMPILDIEKLDRAHPDNESYLRILKLRGIIKVDQETAEGADEMAASEVLGNLTNKALDMLGNQPQAQPQASSDPNGIGISKALDLLDKQYQRATPPAQQGTVKEQLEGLVTLAKTMTPPAAPVLDMGPYLALHEKNNELVERLMNIQIQQAQAEATKAKEEAAQYRAALPQPKTVDEQWDELERAAKRFDRMTGKKQRDEDAEEEDKAPSTAAGFWGGLLGALPAIMKSGVELLREGNVMLYNYKLNGVGAVPLNPATGQPGTEPLQPQSDEEPDDANLSPEDRARMEHMQNVANQLTALAQPMLNHVMRNKSGIEFAKFVIENYGGKSFSLIQSTPKETILAMIQNYPPVWNQIAPERVPQFQKFLDEFMGYSAVAVQ